MPPVSLKSIGGLSLLLLTGILLWLALMPRAIDVRVAKLDRGPIQVFVRDDGVAHIRHIARVDAPVAGHLQGLLVEAGDPLEAGKTVLAYLRPADPSLLDPRSQREAQAQADSAQASLDLATAERRRARAELAYAQGDWQRAQSLIEEGSISRSEGEHFELALAAARANFDAAKAQIQVRQAQLSQALSLLIPADQDAGAGKQLGIYSPIDGQVLRVMQSQEARLNPGTPLMEIGNREELEIIIDLLSYDAIRVPVGAPVILDNWGGEHSLEGVVRRVEPLATTQISALGIEEQRVRIRVDITSPPTQWQGLGHGYHVDAAIEIDAVDNALRLPISTLFREGQDWAVFVQDGEFARLQGVQIGRQNQAHAELLSPLPEGLALITHPDSRLADGSRIRVVDRE